MSTPKQFKYTYKEGQLSLQETNECLLMLELKTKGYATKMLPDEETLIVATAKMKNIASQPQRTKRVAASLNKIIEQLSQQGGKKGCCMI